MDLLKESIAGAGKVVAARHISAEKSHPESNYEINTTLLCHSYSFLPDFGTYLAALHKYAWVLWSCELIVLIGICVLYAVTIRSAMRHWKESFANVAVVLGVYPIVAAAGFLAIVLPRGRILAEAIAQEAVMIAMYKFFCMIIIESNGPDQLVRRAAGAKLQTRVLPCCCWPCCIIPRPTLQTKHLMWLRYLVLQMPIVQAVLYVIILALWAEDMMLYHRNFVYLQPFVASSILTGVWGTIMCVRAAESAGHKVKPRFLSLQLVLIIVKVQCGFAKVLPDVIDIPCIVSLNPSTFVNMIQNSVMMVEMLLLSIWAWRLYRVPPGKDIEKPSHIVVAVLDDSVKYIDVKTGRDGVENKTFNDGCE